MKQVPAEQSPWRVEVVARALAYANHVWTPSGLHAYHGLDLDGVAVDTPDIGHSQSHNGWWAPDQTNIGMPYMWGGFSFLEEFDAGIAAGRYAGDVPVTREKRSSRYCVGVDCSGLVSRCWGVDKKLSTRTVPQVADPLSSMDQLLPGDALLRVGHVMLFTDFLDEKKTIAKIVDASRRTGKVLAWTVSLLDLERNGFIPYRMRTEVNRLLT